MKKERASEKKNATHALKTMFWHRTLLKYAVLWFFNYAVNLAMAPTDTAARKSNFKAFFSPANRNFRKRYKMPKNEREKMTRVNEIILLTRATRARRATITHLTKLFAWLNSGEFIWRNALNRTHDTSLVVFFPLVLTRSWISIHVFSCNLRANKKRRQNSSFQLCAKRNKTSNWCIFQDESCFFCCCCAVPIENNGVIRKLFVSVESITIQGIERIGERHTHTANAEKSE